MKDQEFSPRPHTLRPAALPAKVEQWVKVSETFASAWSAYVPPTEIDMVQRNHKIASSGFRGILPRIFSRTSGPHLPLCCSVWR